MKAKPIHVLHVDGPPLGTTGQGPASPGASVHRLVASFNSLLPIALPAHTDYTIRHVSFQVYYSPTYFVRL
jgi:hypothetical protein